MVMETQINIFNVFLCIIFWSSSPGYDSDWESYRDLVVRAFDH